MSSWSRSPSPKRMSGKSPTLMRLSSWTILVLHTRPAPPRKQLDHQAHSPRALRCARARRLMPPLAAAASEAKAMRATCGRRVGPPPRVNRARADRPRPARSERRCSSGRPSVLLQLFRRRRLLLFRHRRSQSLRFRRVWPARSSMPPWAERLDCLAGFGPMQRFMGEQWDSESRTQKAATDVCLMPSLRFSCSTYRCLGWLAKWTHTWLFHTMASTLRRSPATTP
mmetsp:Transcript_9584/g.33983  ORF Transcript_9584/g.33983 Transcript_9584/m.33983 type:complete len:226 (+) Transcript_9584:802-1479(+)